MTRVDSQPVAWARRTWLGMIALVFIVQLILIFGLSDHSSLRVRSASRTPGFRLAGPRAIELLAVEDPTLFALPHRRGFSGPAWMIIPPTPAKPFTWSETPPEIVLATRELGSAFNLFAATNELRHVPALEPEQPILVLSEGPPLAGAVSSNLRIEGALADRRMTKPLTLRSWSSHELLSNSIVQVVVNAEGKPISNPALLASSGDPQADKDALDQSRSIRFEPTPGAATTASNSLSILTWGKLVFEWHTLATNAAGGKP